MDPYAALQRLRELLGGDHSGIEDPPTQEEADEAVATLCSAEEVFQGLDEWMKKGGGSPWERLGVWTCVGFEGHWPVGTSAVVVAPTEMEARAALVEELNRVHLPQKSLDGEILDPGLEVLDLTTPAVHILNDGNH